MHFYKLFELKCVLAVCTQPPYNDTSPPSGNCFLKWSHTDGGPIHDCWLTVAFQHRLNWFLTSDPPWVRCHQLFLRRSRCRQEWLLRDLGVLLLDVIMNIIVTLVVYSHHLSGWRGLRLVLKGMRPQSTWMHLCSCKSFVIQLHLQKKSVQAFLN